MAVLYRLGNRPRRREHEHNHTIKGARYTRTRRPVRLVYVEPQPDRSTAMRREIQLNACRMQKRALAQLESGEKNSEPGDVEKIFISR